jgi:hypothetical protein
MKMKHRLALILLILTLPTTSFAMHTYYYDSDTGDYYTIWHDGYGTTFVTDLNTEVTHVKGNYYFDTYDHADFYNNSPYYYNYYPYRSQPFIFFGGGYNYHRGGNHGLYGGIPGYGGVHGKYDAYYVGQNN